LERQGRHVAFVGLLDARLFSGDASGVIADPAENFVLSLQSTLGDASRALDPAEEFNMRKALDFLSDEARLRQALVWAQQRGLLPDDMSLEAFRHQVDLYGSHARMLNAHTAPVIKSPLHVWWARQTCPEGIPPTDWSKHTESGIYEDILDGDHYTLLRPPNSEKLGEKLKERLEMLRTSATRDWDGSLGRDGEGKVMTLRPG
jgi:thioesterase domain-containing protein